MEPPNEAQEKEGSLTQSVDGSNTNESVDGSNTNEAVHGSNTNEAVHGSNTNESVHGSNTGKFPSTVTFTSAGIERKSRRVVHPFSLRLKDTSGIAVDSALALVSAGYASIAVGLLASFRATPFILFLLSLEYRPVSPDLNFSKIPFQIMVCTWMSLLITVLLILGIVLVVSRKIRKRGVLVLHPWGLLLLYLDIFVWLSLILWLHMQIVLHPELYKRIFEHVHYPILFFTFMYIESILFGILYYLYATYFIAAELTVIEKFF